MTSRSDGYIRSRPMGNRSVVPRMLDQAKPGWPFHWGVVEFDEKTSDQTGVTSVTDVSSLTVTFDATAGRRYKISASVRTVFTASSGVAVVRITDGSNTSLAASSISHSGSDNRHHSFFTVQTPGEGSVTYKVRAETGSGTMTVQGSATAPSVLLVEDVGPA